MDFWNDYEGKIIADNYPLEKLLYPEGRSGFFSTRNGTGNLAILRLTESLNDQRDMLEQWQIVQRLNHPNLIGILKFGPTVVDEIPLVYAVLEPADATLAEILAERPMTADETREIATSLVAALRALHDSGLIHGHLEPASVRAVGETVKLRSDCVRKIQDDLDDAKKLKAEDVRDLCLVLRQALTQQRSQASTSTASLPAPFDRIVPNGIDGVWGLEEIAAALEPRRAATTPTVAAGVVPARAAISSEPAVAAVEASHPAPGPINVAPVEPELPFPQREEPWNPSPPWWQGKLPWIVALIVLVVAVFGWRMLRSSTANSTADSAPVASSSPASTTPPLTPAPAATVAPASPPIEAAASAAAATGASTGAPHEVWRLVVFTYNRQSQAEAKVTTIQNRNGSLNPGVFSPSGKAPFLVTLGGPMSHQDAAQLMRKAKSEGFPRDSYVQNFTGK